jgi:argininosuccinate lyase
VGTQSKLAEDLEIWASQEFDYVTLADGFSRSSVLMPQKRNPYALSIIRGASGTLIGRVSGFLAVVKSPSARSDNLIFAYGEVPRALDLSIRVTRLMSGVVRTLRVNAARMAEELDGGYTQATDLCEFIVQTCGVDYRSAYVVVGKTVREASRQGIAGKDITGAMLDEVALAETGRAWGLTDRNLDGVLDPRAIVDSRVGTGGAAPSAVEGMIAQCLQSARDLKDTVRRRRQDLDDAEHQLLESARRMAATEESS